MKDCSREELESSRPEVSTEQAITYCLDAISKNVSKEMRNERMTDDIVRILAHAEYRSEAEDYYEEDTEITIILEDLFENDKISIKDDFVKDCTYEELIGALLLTRDLVRSKTTKYINFDFALDTLHHETDKYELEKHLADEPNLCVGYPVSIGTKTGLGMYHGIFDRDLSRIARPETLYDPSFTYYYMDCECNGEKLRWHTADEDEFERFKDLFDLAKKDSISNRWEKHQYRIQFAGDTWVILAKGIRSLA